MKKWMRILVTVVAALVLFAGGVIMGPQVTQGVEDAALLMRMRGDRRYFVVAEIERRDPHLFVLTVGSGNEAAWVQILVDQVYAKTLTNEETAAWLNEAFVIASEAMAKHYTDVKTIAVVLATATEMESLTGRCVYAFPFVTVLAPPDGWVEWAQEPTRDNMVAMQMAGRMRMYIGALGRIAEMLPRPSFWPVPWESECSVCNQ